MVKNNVAIKLNELEENGPITAPVILRFENKIIRAIDTNTNPVILFF